MYLSYYDHQLQNQAAVANAASGIHATNETEAAAEEPLSIVEFVLVEFGVTIPSSTETFTPK
jgi:hypothetical protein